MESSARLRRTPLNPSRRLPATSSTAASSAAALVLVVIVALNAVPAQTQLKQRLRSNHATNAPVFYRDVLPILQEHCQTCHRANGIAPVSLETYEHTKLLADAIRAAVENRSMPPWFADPGVGRFSNDPSLSVEQIATLKTWAKTGAAAGDFRHAPPPRRWRSSWTIAKPDLILTMNPVALPPRGDVEYTYEILSTRFREDRWIRASELLPGLPANVHHAVVYVRPPDSRWLRGAPIGKPFTASSLASEEDRHAAQWTDSDVLLVYAPGSSPDDWPANMAKFIPAGSDLVFQMHYTTNGKAAFDRTALALIFSKEAPRERVLTLQLTNDHFVIPPGAANYRVEARGTLPNDATLLSLFPHMHLRGKRFEYNILHGGTGADGRLQIEPLLRVNYHFHWQMSYRLAEPLRLPAGTELQAVAWYDNSGSNPHNPDPTAAVRWGEQTYDEMMVGFFDVAVPAGLSKQQYFRRNAPPSP